jgi:hypothetical protein
LGYFPELKLAGRPYNLWLTDEILEPVLQRWAQTELRGKQLTAEIADRFEEASLRCREAFRGIRPVATPLGDPAVMAALAVTANLQRTLATLGEFVLAGRSSARGAQLRLSRNWCGLVEYPPGAPDFGLGSRPPTDPARLHPRRRDPRHLGNALWCSLGAINSRCENAIGLLRWEIRRSGAFGPDDLRHLFG